MTSISTLAEQLRALGVAEGGVLLVHTSFRAVRPVEDGPRGLIEALLQALGIVAQKFWRRTPDAPSATRPGPTGHAK